MTLGHQKGFWPKKKKKCFRQTQLVEQPEPFYWCYMTFEYTELKTSQKEKKKNSFKKVSKFEQIKQMETSA